MDIKKSGTQPPGKGPAEYFTGAVRIDPLFEAPAPVRAVGASVTFEPGARTALAQSPVRSDSNRDGGLWARPVLGWADPRHSPRGRDLV